MLWCLVGLSIGLSAWLGGRTYLKRTLAAQLTTASTEAVALQSIDALLRLDANATIEVSRGLAHPEFMVANAAFRALGGQLDAWTKLEPADRLSRMQKVVTELERIPDDIDQDHRILVSGLASRIYADTLSSREIGAGDVLEGCRRVLARTDPQHVPTRLARLNKVDKGSVEGTEGALRTDEGTGESRRVAEEIEGAVPAVEGTGASVLRLREEETGASALRLRDEQPQRLHFASGPNAMPHATAPAQPAMVRMPTLKTQDASDPLSESSSSRSRVIVPDMESTPTKTTEPEQPAALGGIDQLPIDQLVRLLSSVQPRVSQAAYSTLRQRGMSAENLDMAVQLATGSVENRQQLLSQLAQRDDLDARPWLLWMAADGQDAVRQQAVALLQPIADTDVRRQLRLLLNKERDEKVAQTIRKVLLK